MNKKLTLAALAAAAVAASAFTSTSMSWDGSDTEGKVVTGSDEETAGYWYEYTDKDNDGDSKIVFPSDVEANTYGNFYGPLAEAYGGIKADVQIGTAYEYPFAGFGFNIVSENQEGADISGWGGVALTYNSTGGFAIELGIEDEATATEYNNYKASVAKGNTSTSVAWAKFKQESGWGVKVDQAVALTKIAAIKLKFTASADFLLTCIADANTGCGPATKSIKASAAEGALKAQLTGRTLSFGKVVKAELVNLQGQVVASANASSMDLSKVQAGVYMVRAEGLSQRIMVK
ncbi:T9SS type A sorting domain-containing protein [Fibrobacter sp. UWEL]|uniref:T9SS type A sorting domain-containing protein n=1 Tax=Fibrobacter sp. UWEL TaxID=1896209 RepID=UPI000915985E|nr:T9SS type A sorting domain-containing protein [Fibrobacter sp. UWEL]SHK76632.1 Por secretion system C-terminal sorting domain-containing protein [Fibrobacter sp. UWEL]